MKAAKEPADSKLNSKRMLGFDDPFPKDLTTLDDTTLEVLYARVRRAQDCEYLAVNPQLETEIRLEDLTGELKRRE